MNPRFHNTFIS